MNKDVSLMKFNRLLKLRTLLKSVAQISWNINQLERRYPLETINDEEVNALLSAYDGFVEDLMRFVDELKENAKPTN